MFEFLYFLVLYLCVQLLNNNFTYDEIAEMLGVAKGTVFNYIRRFKIRKIYE